MGLLSDKLSWANLLSGGITGINDDLLKATGANKNSTLYVVNDTMKHGPLETSLEQGKPASTGQLWKDRNQRLAKDETGNARTIGDIAALVGMAFGGAAAAGGSAGGGAAAGSSGAAAGGGTAAGGAAGATTAGTTGAAGSTAATGAGYSGAASNASFNAANTGAASSGSGGFMGGVNSVGQAAGSANQVRGLLSPQQQSAQASPVTVGNGSAMGNVYAQIQQSELQRQQNEIQQRQQRRQGLLGYGG
jgi:hypothetical protein